MIHTLLAVLLTASMPPLDLVVRIDVPSHRAVYDIQRNVDIDVIDVGPGFVKAFASEDEVGQLRTRGWSVTVLDERLEGRSPENLVIYHSYAQSCSVMQALKRLCAGRTTLTIAHRLSTIVDSDEILVMLEGRIAERGTHAELMSQGGWYEQMFTLQQDEVDANLAEGD